MASMPSLSDKPVSITPVACSRWASDQSAEALSMWGIQSDGTTSELVAIDRLAKVCLGNPKPEIVGFGYSAGFNADYCKKHRSEKICTAQKSGEDVARVQEALTKASALAKSSRFAEAFRIWEPLAKKGNAEAQHNLGIMYYFGEGMQRDFSKSLFWRNKAASQNHPGSQLDFGVMYSNGEGVSRDDKIASHWYAKAAEQGNSRAQFNLAKNYEAGAGVAQDKSEALKWYVLAAQQNDEDAQLEAARLYGDQVSSRYDAIKARGWYGKAALNGKAEAQLALGVIYSKGLGVPVDPVRAAMWFRLANGHLSDRVTRDTGAVGVEAGQLLKQTEKALTKQQFDTIDGMLARCGSESSIEAALDACGLR